MRPAIALILLPLAGLLAAADKPFTVGRPLTTATEREELAAVPFDRHVCAATRDGFPDVRVLAPDGQAVPFLLQRHTRLTVGWADLSMPARRVQELLPDATGNRIEVVVEAPRDAVPAWVEILTPLRDFEKRVSVFVTVPGGAWQALSENQAIYDYSRFMDVRRCRILLPEAPAASRYRIVLSDVSESTASAFVELTTRSGGGQPDEETVRRVLHRRDFRIDGIQFGYRVREERRDAPVLVEYPLQITASERDEKAGLTRLTVDSGRLPVTELRVAIAERNVSRAVTVEVHRALDDGTYQWQAVGQGTLTYIDFHGVQEETLSIGIAETRAKELRLVFQDRESPPLTVQGVTAVGPEYRVLFLAQPALVYTLSYGSATAAAPRYEDAVLRRLSDLKDREVRTLELTPADAVAYPSERTWTRLLNSRGMLFMALGLAVGVIAAAMVQAARRLSAETAPPPPPNVGT